MIALAVIMGHKLCNHVSKQSLSEKDHSVQALGFYGSRRKLNEVYVLTDVGAAKLG